MSPDMGVRGGSASRDDDERDALADPAHAFFYVVPIERIVREGGEDAYDQRGEYRYDIDDDNDRNESQDDSIPRRSPADDRRDEGGIRRRGGDTI